MPPKKKGKDDKAKKEDDEAKKKADEEAKQAREVISNEEAALKAEEAAAKQWLDDICKSLDHMDKTYSKYNEFNVVVQQMINDTRYPSNKLLIDLQYRLLIFLPILGYRIVFSWETGRQ